MRPIRPESTAARRIARRCLRTAVIAVVTGSSAGLFGCAGASNPLDDMITWSPWERDDPADLARYGPTNVQKRQQISEIAADAARSGADVQQQTAARFADRLKQENDPLVRIALVRGLGGLTTSAVQAPLTHALTDDDIGVRMAACEAWGRQRSPEAVAYLSAALAGDESPDVRIAAARALGNRRQENEREVVTAALAAALTQDDPALRYRAAESLEEITGESYGRDPNLWAKRMQGETVARRNRPLGEMIDDWY
jgi:hypothetical protein